MEVTSCTPEMFSLKPFLALPHCLSIGFPKQKVRKPVAMAYSLAYDNDMLMNLYSHGFQGPKHPVAKKMQHIKHVARQHHSD